MFAPVGYLPLSQLWDSFIEARRVQFHRHAVTYFNSDGFEATLLRGGPFDMAEYVFLKEISQRGVYVASSDGRIFRLSSKFKDGHLGLFSQVDPYRSSEWATAPDRLQGRTKTVDRIGGSAFVAWASGPMDDAEWRRYYGGLVDLKFDATFNVRRHLRYHSLPICFERGRFVIVQELPFWTPDSQSTHDLNYIVDNFSGWSLCVQEGAVSDWDTYLANDDLSLEGAEASTDDRSVVTGRPPKVPRVAEIFATLYPTGRNETWKKVIRKVSNEFGESISKQTIIRAIAVIDAEKASDQ